MEKKKEVSKKKIERKEKTTRTPQEIKDLNTKNRFDNAGNYYKTKKRFIN